MKIGRVLLIPKGDYDNLTTYDILDWVRYNGAAWVCKLPGTIGIEPTEGPNWAKHAVDGFSPSAAVSRSGDTITISILDEVGPSISTIVVPNANISKTEGKSTITIKDENGTTQEIVYDGNRWFRGTDISGKIASDTSYPTNIGYANIGDNYLNPTEGAVYYCTASGNDNIAKWKYDFTLTGGGGGGSQAWINGVEVSGRLTSTDLGITWIGTHPEFDTDSAAGLIPDGTVLIFTDDYIEPEEATWGKIKGEISDQEDLKTELDNKVSKADLFETEKNLVGGDAWQSGKPYVVDDTCIYNNIIYACIANHTSSDSILPTDTTKWVPTSIKKITNDISTLNTKLTLKTGGITVDTNLVTSYSSNISKVGEIAQVYLYLIPKQDINVETVVGSIPSEYISKKSCVFAIPQGGILFITASGEIKLNNVKRNENIYMSCMYIIN